MSQMLRRKRPLRSPVSGLERKRSRPSTFSTRWVNLSSGRGTKWTPTCGKLSGSGWLNGQRDKTGERLRDLPTDDYSRHTSSCSVTCPARGTPRVVPEADMGLAANLFLAMKLSGSSNPIIEDFVWMRIKVPDSRAGTRQPKGHEQSVC